MTEPKVALIIGGSGGIGAAAVKTFSQAGFKVYATALRGQAQGCQALRCDTRDPGQVAAVFEAVLAQGGRLDVLLDCSASALKLRPFDALTAEEFREDVDVILLGAANVLRHAVPAMKKAKQGAIILLGTTAALSEAPSRMSSYVAAKCGLLGLARALAAELKAFNVRVVTLSPSYVETNMLKAFPAKLLELEREKLPGKRLLQPEEVASLALAAAQQPEKFKNGRNAVVRDAAELKEML